MAPKSLAEQIADLEDLTPRDFDPEDIERGGQSSDDEVPVKDANAGREHYQAVGKAKLRKEDPIALGKQYAGSRVSRDALEADSDDDPFTAQSSDEGSEDEDEDLSDDLEGSEDDEDEDISEGSEDERLQKPKAAIRKGRINLDDQGTDGSEDIEDDDIEDFDEDGFSDEDDEEEDDDDEDDEDDMPSNRRVKFDSKSDDREQLRQLMATDQKTIAATISQAAKADATKGKAVKQQRATFDALLNARIKLQKGLTAVNQLSTTAQNQSEDDEIDADAFKSAETAALTLWSTLEDLRLTLADAQTQDESKKRKRPSPATPTTSKSSLWARMTELESTAVTHRRAILDKWSLKVRGANTTTLANSKTNKLLGTASGQQTITAVLDAHIASETADSRATKRARNNTTYTTNGTTTPNSDDEPEPVYSDAIFYQSLLRDLVEQRMSSSDAITNGIDTLHLLPSRNVHPVTGMRKDKVKRDVDTRASKGRKMRFDVHEKLQNFMAPEERGTWTTHARDELFASLLGKTASGLLGEEDEDDRKWGDESEDEDMEEGGLRLFRG
ncbi:apoptosis-antagonizing transcription factor [Aspergillus pseudoustus]|uniref:Protein BFR2 n=1 Tax=Aspergillus pseudoustus TaxID=1810923 RepID=A0ABR4KMI0_9EURO